MAFKYEPQEGDVFTSEVRSDRFTLHRYQGGRWQRTESVVYSKQELTGLLAVMQFLGEEGKRRYYRPLLQYRVKE